MPCGQRHKTINFFVIPAWRQNFGLLSYYAIFSLYFLFTNFLLNGCFDQMRSLLKFSEMFQLSEGVLGMMNAEWVKKKAAAVAAYNAGIRQKK